MLRRSRPSGAGRPGFRSISTKLAWLVLASMFASLLVGTGAAMWQETLRYTRAKRETITAAAEVFAKAAGPALARRDVATLDATLNGILDIPDMVYGAVLDSDGFVVADRGLTAVLDGDAALDTSGAQRSVQELVLSDLMRLKFSRSVSVNTVVLAEGAPVGRFLLVADLAGLPQRLLETLATTLLASLGALVVGLGVAYQMQRGITRPIRRLAATMGGIGRSHDYAVAVEAGGNDEVGQLVDSFRHMLGEIHERDLRIARHTEHLESEVEERTRDLRAAKVAAEEANAAKSNFLATMSHEIRTPMNGMLVMAELLAAGELPPRQRRFADVIARSGQSLLAIINDILDFSKVEAGKMELEVLAFDPVETVDTVLGLFWERARGKGLDLAAFVAPDVPAMLHADPVRLNQVLGNLVNNALKFTKEGHVLLCLERDREDPGLVRFSVIDTGIGIPAATIPTLFEAFSQADQSTTRQFGGTGLGLAICRRLVDAMGGSFAVTSEVGHGSTFSFAIPCGAGAVPRAMPAPRRGQDGEPPRAVVAVAGEATSLAAAGHLSALGWQVERRPPGLLEAGLPDTDLLVAEGTALVAAPRGDGRQRPATILALASLGDGSESRIAEARLADALIARPLTPGELMALTARIAAGEPLVLSTKAGPAVALPSFRGARVLVADDSPVNREVAAEALARLEVTAVMAEDGRSAVKMALDPASRIDLILMDGSMPDIDGFDAARRIRALAEGAGQPRIPILSFTAHVVGTAAELWRECGMDGVLHKPFTIQGLAEALRPFLQAVDGAGAIDTLPGPQPEPEAAPAAGPDGPVIDPGTLAQFQTMSASDGGAFLRRVVGLYRNHAPGTLATLRAAVEAGADGATAQAKAAHALKSMSVNIGAVQVAALASALETRVKAEGGLVTAADANELELRIAAALAAFDDMVPEGATGPVTGSRGVSAPGKH